MKTTPTSTLLSHSQTIFTGLLNYFGGVLAVKESGDIHAHHAGCNNSCNQIACENG